MTKQIITNTEILMFIMGWQGGTIHQVVEELSKKYQEINPNSDSIKELFYGGKNGCLGDWMSLILDANYDQMQDLMRLAQRVRCERDNQKLVKAQLKKFAMLVVYLQWLESGIKITREEIQKLFDYWKANSVEDAVSEAFRIANEAELLK